MIDPKLRPADKISPGRSKIGLPKSWSRADLAGFVASCDDDAISTISTYVTHEERVRETNRKLSLAKLNSADKKFNAQRRK
jgi:hypothetical protein